MTCLEIVVVVEIPFDSYVLFVGCLFFRSFYAVFALWMVPELLPSFVLKGGEVSRYVIGGADLMFPGISVSSEGLLSFQAGEPWAVKVPGNPAAIAVSFIVSSFSFSTYKPSSPGWNS